MPYKILRKRQVKERTGLCDSAIYYKIQQREFPSPIKISERAVGWLENEINDWIKQRIDESRLEEEV